MPATHLLLLWLICLAWAGNFLVSAIALQSMPPFLYTAVRLAMVLVVLFPFLRAPAAGYRPRLAAVAILNGSLHFGLNFWALREAGDLSPVAIAMQSYVPMSVILSVWLLGERIGWRTTLAVTISFGGIIVLSADPGIADHPFALFLCLISALSLALGSVLMRGLEGVGPFALQAWSALIGLPLLLVSSQWLEGPVLDNLAQAQPQAFAGAAYSALLASIVGHGLYFTLVRRYGVSAVTPHLLLTPVLAVLLGVAFWGDQPGWRLLLGGALVLGGVLIVALRARSKARTPPAPAATI